VTSLVSDRRQQKRPCGGAYEINHRLRNLIVLVSLGPMTPADEWNDVASLCWPREVGDLKVYGAKMRTNVLRDRS